MTVYNKRIDESCPQPSSNQVQPLNINLSLKDIDLAQLKNLIQLNSEATKQNLDKVFNGNEGLALKLGTNIKTGITDTKIEIETREQAFGRNEIKPNKPKTILQLCVEALKDPTLCMLMICAVISIGLSFYQPADEFQDEELGSEIQVEANLEWVEGVAIMIAVVVVVSVTAFNDWRKEKQFRGLQNKLESDNMANVIRSGYVKQILVKDIVVGDLCLIKYGDLVPADGILTQASDLTIDESSLTGETEMVRKTLDENITILSGTGVKLLNKILIKKRVIT